jgi:Flp pilus assembly protein TadD
MSGVVPRWLLSHARGYVELGMFDAAARELAALPEAVAEGEEALDLFAAVHHERRDWSALARVSEKLVQLRPDSAGAWVTWAYAVRRATSLAAAERILLSGREHHPRHPTILFNLGCYACQRGDLALARRLVEAAGAIDATFRALAETDEDLEPLRRAPPPPADAEG